MLVVFSKVSNNQRFVKDGVFFIKIKKVWEITRKKHLTMRNAITPEGVLHTMGKKWEVMIEDIEGEI